MVWWPAYRRERAAVLFVAVVVASFGFGGAVALLLSFSVASLPAYFFVAAAFLCILSLLAVAFCIRLYGHLTESVLLARKGVRYVKPVPRGLVWRLLGWDDESGLLQAGLGIDRFIVRSIGSWRSLWRSRDEVAVSREAVTDLRVEGRGRFGHVTIAVVPLIWTSGDVCPSQTVSGSWIPCSVGTASDRTGGVPRHRA